MIGVDVSRTLRQCWDDVGTMLGQQTLGQRMLGQRMLGQTTECLDGRTLGRMDVGTMLGRQDNVC